MQCAVVVAHPPYVPNVAGSILIKDLFYFVKNFL